MKGYRGGLGFYAWLLHRVTGILITIFLVFHILDTYLVIYPEIYDFILEIYRSPIFKIGEFLLVACVLYHALNGIRIMVMEWWPALTARHRELFYFLVVGPFVFLYLAFLVALLGGMR